jgi:hypothetical protein
MKTNHATAAFFQGRETYPTADLAEWLEPETVGPAGDYTLTVACPYATEHTIPAPAPRLDTWEAW